MEIEQGAQIISMSRNGKPVQPSPVEETDESGNPPPQKGLNLRPFLRTFQRKAGLIVALTVIAAGASAVQIKFFSKKTYQGDFRILVEPVTTEARIAEPLALARGEGLPSRDVFSLDYPTQLEILQSPQMLSAIAQRASKRTQNPKFTAEILKKGLGVVRLGASMLDQTKIIEVRYMGQDPKEVQIVLEETAKKYLKYSLDERKSRIGEGVKFIEDQLPNLQQRVDSLKSELQVLQQQQKLTDPKVQGEELLNRLRELETQELETQRQLQEQKTLYATLQRQLDFSPNEAIAASAVSEEPQYKELLAKLKEVEGQIAIESARFRSANPYLEVLERKRTNLIALLNREQSRILGQNLGSTAANSKVLAFQNSVRLALIKQLVDTANQIQVLEVRNQALSQTKNDLNREVKQFPSVARRYNELEQQLEIATRTRDQLLTQRETLRVQAAQNQVPWEMISKPQIPRDPEGNLIPAPTKSKNKFVMALLGGLALGMVLAIVLEKWRNIFYTSDDLKDGVPFPLLGDIPFEPKEQPLLSANGLMTLPVESGYTAIPSSKFSEAFDSLYTNLHFLFADRPVRSLVVCSATAGEGASTVALNLARTAAQAGQRVILVDANLHAPSLHQQLDLPNFRGLSNLLCGNLELNEAIERVPDLDNLFVLTAGLPIPGAAKRFASNQMQHLMENLRTAFDLVICDAPPLTDAKDTNFLATCTEGVLMVVTVRKTKRSLVKKVFNQLENFGIPCLGVVANHITGKGTRRQTAPKPRLPQQDSLQINGQRETSPVPSTDFKF